MIENLWFKLWDIWTAGGWVMIPLLMLSFFLYLSAYRLLGLFSSLGFHRLGEKEWMGWVRNPETARGEVGEIIRYTQDDVRSVDEVHGRFEEVAHAVFPMIDRRLSFLNVLVAGAPLLGLLGTVFGMLMTFKALAVSGGKLTEMMSSGIAQALFPPEVGLCVALPGLVLMYVIKRKRHEYEAFLAQIESYTIQALKGRLEQTEDRTIPAAETGAAAA